MGNTSQLEPALRNRMLLSFKQADDNPGERDALLKIMRHAEVVGSRVSATDGAGSGVSFGNENVSYCEWEGVRCCEQHGHYLSSSHLSAEGVFDFLTDSLGPAFERLSDLGIWHSLDVSCQGKQSVVALNLSSMGLRGTIPDVFHDLPNLQILILNNNPYLQGSLPMSLLGTLLWDLNVAETALTCHGTETATDKGVEASCWRLDNISASTANAAGCPLPSWLEFEADTMRQFVDPEGSRFACPVPLLSHRVVNNSTNMSLVVHEWDSLLVMDPFFTDFYNCSCQDDLNLHLCTGQDNRVWAVCKRDDEGSINPFLWTASGMLLLTLLFPLCVAQHKHLAQRQLQWRKRRLVPGTLMKEVTFVFTRIEHATLISKQLHPDAWALVLQMHMEVLRRFVPVYTAFSLVDSKGDQTNFAFHDPIEAVCWCLQVQNELRRAVWPEVLHTIPQCKRVEGAGGSASEPLFSGPRVQMSVCTGVPKHILQRPGKSGLKGIEYRGPHLALCEDILDAIHGGQVILDEQTFRAISGRLEELDMAFTAHSEPKPRGFLSLWNPLCGTVQPGGSGNSDRHSSREAQRREAVAMDGDHANEPQDDECEQTVMVIDMGQHEIVSQTRTVRSLLLTQLSHADLLGRVASYPPLKTKKQLSPGFFDAPGGNLALRQRLQSDRNTELMEVVLVFCSMEGFNEMQAYNLFAAEQAMTIYCTCVRELLNEMCGYECQEMEGTYMIAFHTSSRAVEWALLLQLLLLRIPWSENVLKLRPAREVLVEQELLFSGPRAKIGLYQGKPQMIVPHSTTGRADYFGKLVNRAARMMSASFGGQVLVEKKTLQETMAHWASLIEQPSEAQLPDNGAGGAAGQGSATCREATGETNAAALKANASEPAQQGHGIAACADSRKDGSARGAAEEVLPRLVPVDAHRPGRAVPVRGPGNAVVAQSLESLSMHGSGQRPSLGRIDSNQLRSLNVLSSMAGPVMVELNDDGDAAGPVIIKHISSYGRRANGKDAEISMHKAQMLQEVSMAGEPPFSFSCHQQPEDAPRPGPAAEGTEMPQLPQQRDAKAFGAAAKVSAMATEGCWQSADAHLLPSRKLLPRDAPSGGTKAGPHQGRGGMRLGGDGLLHPSVRPPRGPQNSNRPWSASDADSPAGLQRIRRAASLNHQQPQPIVPPAPSRKGKGKGRRLWAAAITAAKRAGTSKATSSKARRGSQPQSNFHWENSAVDVEKVRHVLEVHDLGRYMMKGLQGTTDVMLVNLQILSGRNALFPDELPTGKATRLQMGTGNMQTLEVDLLDITPVVTQVSEKVGSAHLRALMSMSAIACSLKSHSHRESHAVPATVVEDAALASARPTSVPASPYRSTQEVSDVMNQLPCDKDAARQSF